MQASVCQGQKKYLFQAEAAVAAASVDALPFWLRSNEHGLFQDSSNLHGLTRLGRERNLSSDRKIAWSWKASGYFQKGLKIIFVLPYL